MVKSSVSSSRLPFSRYYKRRLLASILALRYRGAKDLQTNSRSPYAYWHLHLHPILLRFPRRTRACNSFSLSDRVYRNAVSALIYRSVSRDGIRKRETAALQIMPRAMRVVVLVVVVVVAMVAIPTIAVGTVDAVVVKSK